MAVDLHLLSTPGVRDIRYIIEACLPYLKRQHPVVAFMQWASVGHDWLPYTQKAFSGIAEVLLLKPDLLARHENENILGRSAVVYISGGNTYLLNHLLHTSGLLSNLRGHAQNGLPIVGFSAGALLCGPNILTTHDINMVPTTHFDGLDLLPYNIVAHYPGTETGQNEEDDWLTDYQARHHNPILAIEDDSYVQWEGENLKLVRGNAWLLESANNRTKLK